MKDRETPRPATLRLRFQPEDDETERTIEVPADRPFELFSILENYRPRCRVTVLKNEEELCSLRLNHFGLYEMFGPDFFPAWLRAHELPPE